MFSTPILFLIFNREDTTRQVFEAIRKQKPKYLYVAADGPRKYKAGEEEKCRKTRDVIKGIDWDCELKTLFRAENLGCKKAVSSAITWFFENEEKGIILEDDCLPDPSFFPYCEELLEKYKNDERIGHISGNCFFPDYITPNQSYDFSSMSHIWGWASWKRVWANYDVDLSFWGKNKNNKAVTNNLFNSWREKIYFSSFLTDTLTEKGKINTWDVQYLYSLRLQNQLSIYPSVNLVTNIGLNSEGATHTKKNSDKHYRASSAISFPLEHPSYIFRDKNLDQVTMKKSFFSWKRLIRYFLGNY